MASTTNPMAPMAPAAVTTQGECCGDGGGNPQTPWTQDIDGASYSLNNVGSIASNQGNFYITGVDNLFLGTTSDGNTLVGIYQGPFVSIGCPMDLQGKLNIQNLPTSSAGLNPGDVWNNGGVLNIV